MVHMTPWLHFSIFFFVVLVPLGFIIYFSFHQLVDGSGTKIDSPIWESLAPEL